MRTTIILSALLALCTTAYAQNGRSGPGLVPQRIEALHQQGATFAPVALFASAHADQQRDARWRDAVADATLLSPSRAAFAGVLADRPEHLRLDLPAEGGALSLDLEQVDFFTDDFSVVTASTGVPFAYAPGLYYRGAVSGDPNSLVAISIFKDEVMGFVTKAEGNKQATILNAEAQLEAARLNAVIATDRADLAEDIARGAPDVVMIESREVRLREMAHPQIAAALAPYRLDATVDGVELWTRANGGRSGN